jgi:hypothetical protein
VNSLFFWIIVLSFLVPTGMRMYRRSVQRRNQGRTLPGQYPDQFGGYYQGRPDNRPRDGYTQQDYLSGGLGLPRGTGQQQPPQDQPYPIPPYPNSPFPGTSPNQPGYQDPQSQPPQQAAAPSTPPPPSAPQGFRARKLAELDQQYSNGEISMEDYMTRRNDIMNG